MKTKAKIFSLFAATCVAFSSVAHAQLLTYQTVQPVAPSSGFADSVLSFNTTSRKTQGEIFTNVLAIDSMSYVLFTTAGTTLAANLQATFGQWNTLTNTFTGPTLDLGILPVPTNASWSTLTIDGTDYESYIANFDITAANGSMLYTTNPTLSYALMLTNISGLSNPKFGIGLTNSETDFAYGTGAYISNTNVFSSGGSDFTFSAISIIPNPVPESGTVAAIAGAMLVAGLVGFRIRQRRNLVLAPVATA